MNRLYLILFLLLSSLLLAEVSFVSGFLNDNYTGSIENGASGNYIGADDFLTFTLFAKSKSGNLGISEYYHVITSRKYGYRYDLLDTNISYDLKISDYNFSPSVSILYKSDLGGQIVQNGFHALRNLPDLVQEYVETESAIAVGLRGNFTLESILLEQDSFRGLLNIDIPSSIKPVSASLAMEYLLNFKYLDFDIVGGYKQYITTVDQYSDFIRSGLIFGGQGVITLLDKFTINAGAFFFPTRNLDNDPYYFSKSHNYSPQFWITFGLNGSSYGVMDIVNF